MALNKLKVFFDQAQKIPEFKPKYTDQIECEEQWQEFLQLTLRNHLLKSEDIEQIQQIRPPLPLTFECVMSSISRCIKDEVLSKLINLSLKAEVDIITVRAMIAKWDPDTMTKQEIGQLLYVLYQLQNSLHSSETILKQNQSSLEKYSEDVQQLVYDRVRDTTVTIKTAHIYQDEEMDRIEKLWYENRVRMVQYRNRPVKVLKQYNNGVIKQLGFCADKDFPVEVWKIPVNLADYEYLQQFYQKVVAQKQLIFSKYYQNYLGFDDLSDQQYNQYFFEFSRGHNIRSIIKKQSIFYQDYLLEYWSKEILLALKDLLHICTCSILQPITLQNIFVYNEGLKIFIKGIIFGDIRDEISHYETEANLLHMYGQIMTELIDPNEQKLQNYPVQQDFALIIEECLKAPQRFQEQKQWILDQQRQSGDKNITLEELENQSNIMKRNSFILFKRKRLKVPQTKPSDFLKQGLSFNKLLTHPYFSSGEQDIQERIDKIISQFGEISCVAQQKMNQISYLIIKPDQDFTEYSKITINMFVKLIEYKNNHISIPRDESIRLLQAQQELMELKQIGQQMLGIKVDGRCKPSQNIYLGMVDLQGNKITGNFDVHLFYRYYKSFKISFNQYYKPENYLTNLNQAVMELKKQRIDNIAMIHKKIQSRVQDNTNKVINSVIPHRSKERNQIRKQIYYEGQISKARGRHSRKRTLQQGKDTYSLPHIKLNPNYTYSSTLYQGNKSIHKSSSGYGSFGIVFSKLRVKLNRMNNFD